MQKTPSRSGFSFGKLLVVFAAICAFAVLLFVNIPQTAVYSKQAHQDSIARLATTSVQVSGTTTPVAKSVRPNKVVPVSNVIASASATPMIIVPMTPLDIPAYNAKMLQIANLPPLPVATGSTTASTTVIRKPGSWPVTSAPYPLPGALLPGHRIIAYYGNLYSRSMGVLGKYDPPEMFAMLASTTRQWNEADPTTPAIPALDYIAVVAQASAGSDGKYRARMPDSEIDKVVALAAQIHGIVILEIQPGLSSVRTEVPLLESYLKLPQVHLALDPEFAMHNGAKPGTVVGTLDASDVNFVANYLAKLVKENNLPPKVLIVHRFTQAMLTNAKKITPLPEVQVVIDMDGFGSPSKKIGTYTNIVLPEPVQFTGFKLFYKNDVVAGHLMTPTEVLKLSPRPSFIQYQ